MGIKERWIFVFFLFYLVLTFVLSREEWQETFIDRELSCGEAKQIVGMVQDLEH